MADLCCWPGCRLEYNCVLHSGKKVFPLCDFHGDKVQSESKPAATRARNTIGMPAPEFAGRVPRFSENGISCCATGCNNTVAVFWEEQPICSTHIADRKVIVAALSEKQKEWKEQKVVPTPAREEYAPQPENEDDDDDGFGDWESKLANGSYE